MGQLTAGYIVTVLNRMLLLHGDGLHPRERDALAEAARRVQQHARLLAAVVPDLRNQLTQAQRRLRQAGRR
jgi:uncharacterized protein with von Willebrand factor type A (vWA) domain